MIALLCFFLTLFASPFKSKSRLEALLRHYDPVSPGAARGHAAASEHQGVSLMGLGKRGRLRVDQPTITG